MTPRSAPSEVEGPTTAPPHAARARKFGALAAAARGDRVVVDDDLVRAAAGEGMLGLLARAATNPHRELQMKAAAIEAHGARMLAELARIATAFDDAGIRLLALKGPVLSQQLYGDPGVRSFSDLDVIVSPRDADGGEALLRTLGYRDSAPMTDAERATNRRFAGEALFRNESNGVLIDFHTLFANRQFPIRLSFDEAWANRVPLVPSEVEAPATAPRTDSSDALQEARSDAAPSMVPRLRSGPVAIATLGGIDLVLLTCSHAAKHLWHKLEYVAQIAALARMSLDWREVERRAKTARVWRQVALSFALAHDLLGVDVPFDADITRVQPLVGKAHDATGRDLFLLFDRKRDVFRSFALSIFVPTHDDYRSRLPWLFRPFRLATRGLSSGR